MMFYNENEQMGWFNIHYVCHEYKEITTELNVVGKAQIEVYKDIKTYL